MAPTELTPMNETEHPSRPPEKGSYVAPTNCKVVYIRNDHSRERVILPMAGRRGEERLRLKRIKSKQKRKTNVINLLVLPNMASAHDINTIAFGVLRLYRERQAQKQEERDCTPVQREGYHLGLKDFQSVLSSFTRYRRREACQSCFSLGSKISPSAVFVDELGINESLTLANIVPGVFRRAPRDIKFKGLTYVLWKLALQKHL
ncbi:hypothetical protein Tco_0578654 [Tanacetum coccineum]